MELFASEFLELLQVNNLLVILLATAAGIVIGATPGLTVNMAVALAVPLTMHLPLAPSLCMLFSLYCSGIYGGSVSAILLNAPGTPASAATVLDGFPLAQQGKAGKALQMALLASFIGGLFSIVVLVLVSEGLAEAALMFGPSERAMLLLFALTLIALLSGDSVLKGLLAGSLGLLLATVGLDPILAVPRFTFGIVSLDDGLNFIPVLIGLFAISEVLLQAEHRMRSSIETVQGAAAGGADNRLVWADIAQSWKSVLRSSVLGTFIGILPGIGASVACFLGYGEAKRSSKHPERFGKGTVEGVAASEAANNAVSGSTLIPLLTLSIPGDSVTAILFGALLIQGITPGPLIFETSLDVVYQIYIILLLANLCMVALGLGFTSFFKYITRAPSRLLFPTIFVICVIGTWSLRNSMFDVYVMMAFGIIGYVLRKGDIPLAPLLIAFILGTPFEKALRQALISSEGSLSIFVAKPIAAAFLILTLISVALTIRRNTFKRAST